MTVTRNEFPARHFPVTIDDDFHSFAWHSTALTMLIDIHARPAIVECDKAVNRTSHSSFTINGRQTNSFIARFHFRVLCAFKCEMSKYRINHTSTEKIIVFCSLNFSIPPILYVAGFDMFSILKRSAATNRSAQITRFQPQLKNEQLQWLMTAIYLRWRVFASFIDIKTGVGFPLNKS